MTINKPLGMYDFDNRSKNHPEAKNSPFGSGIYTGVCVDCNCGFLGYKGHIRCHECEIKSTMNRKPKTATHRAQGVTRVIYYRKIQVRRFMGCINCGWEFYCPYQNKWTSSYCPHKNMEEL